MAQDRDIACIRENRNTYSFGAENWRNQENNTEIDCKYIG
jgi:hypothetical protein